MTILALHFCTQQTVTLNDTNPSKYLSRFGLQPVTIISPIQWRHQPSKVGTFGGLGGKTHLHRENVPKVSPNVSQSWFKHLDPFHIYSTRGRNTNRRRVELIGRAKMTSHFDLCSNRLLENSYPGKFVPRRIRTQNDRVRILWLIRTRVRIIQRIRTLYLSLSLDTKRPPLGVLCLGWAAVKR